MRYRTGRTAILGASGFLGRNLCRYFDERAWPYVAVGRDRGDLADARVCDGVFRGLGGVDTIFHLVTHQRTGFRQYEIPAELLDVNARIHLNVLAGWAAHAPGAKLISTGSSCFYPESETPIPESAFQSGRLHDSVRAYGLAKSLLAVGSEVYATQYKLRYLHCVLATVYGPHDHLEPDRSHFLGGMLLRALQAQKAGADHYAVWGDPATVREVLHVTDQLEAIFAADAQFENRILNCGANQPITVGETARAILDVLGWKTRIEYPPDTFKGTSRKTLDSAVFLNATGWRPRIGLAQGLRETADSLVRAGLV